MLFNKAIQPDKATVVENGLAKVKDKVTPSKMASVLPTVDPEQPITTTAVHNGCIVMVLRIPVASL